MPNKILELLKQLVAIDSTTGTSKEQEIEKYLDGYLHELPYFKEQPHLAGVSPVPNDPYGRSVVYALVLGKKKNTVVLMNHHDVVETDCYGDLQPLAYKMEELTEALKQRTLDHDAETDFASGNWLGGRGSNDMKGGMAAQLAYLEQYAQSPEQGSLLFLSVPDEESFSWGMRHGITLLKELRASHALDYRLCINSEPNRREGGKQVVPVGSVGKLLPFVMLQGKSTHVSEYAKGLNPLGLLAKLVAATEGCTELVEEYEGEKTIAPVWLRMRDCKEKYDFSLPARAVGYCTVQTFQRGPQELLEFFAAKLQEAIAELKLQYPAMPDLPVITYSSLLKYVEDLDFYPIWQMQETAKLKQLIYKEGMSYPEATLVYVQELLDLLGYKEPLAVLGFAPPYYPAVNSSLMEKSYFAEIQKALSAKLDVKFEPYFLGVSDCSYCGLTTKIAPEDYSSNTPLWGPLYSFDMNALAELQIPFMLLGPWGKNLHEPTERVNLESLTETLPLALATVIAKAWQC